MDLLNEDFLAINSQYLRSFRLDSRCGNHYQDHEHQRVDHHMQTKVDQTVNRDTRDTERCSKARRAAESICRLQVLLRQTVQSHCKPNSQSKADHAPARKKFKVIVVRFLR